MALLLFIPAAAVEVVLLTRAPVWNLPWRMMGIWAAAVALICIPLAVWIAHSRRGAWYLAAGFGGCWSVLNFWFAFKNRNPALAFYALFLILLWGVILLWTRREMSRSFFSSGLRWFQGAPRTVPGLQCELSGAAGPLRVSRLDLDGAFLVASREESFQLPTHPGAEMIFLYKDQKIRCAGTVVAHLGDSIDSATGAGIRFHGMSPDARKELGDFVESLRGEGHVQG